MVVGCWLLVVCCLSVDCECKMQCIHPFIVDLSFLLWAVKDYFTWVALRRYYISKNGENLTFLFYQHVKKSLQFDFSSMCGVRSFFWIFLGIQLVSCRKGSRMEDGGLLSVVVDFSVLTFFTFMHRWSRVICPTLLIYFCGFLLGCVLCVEQNCLKFHINCPSPFGYVLIPIPMAPLIKKNWM